MVRWPKWGKHTPDEQSQPDVAEPPAPELHFTEPAHTRLVDLMTQKGILEQGALRITVSALGFGKPEYGMALEESSAPRPDDVEFIIDGLRVLVEERNLEAVDGATVDFLDDPLRPGFSIEPPGAHQHAHPQAPPPRPRPELDLSDPLIAHVSAVIEQQVNPFIANHGGMAHIWSRATREAAEPPLKRSRLRSVADTTPVIWRNLNTSRAVYRRRENGAPKDLYTIRPLDL